MITLSIITLSMMTLSIMTLSIMTLSIMTLSIITLIMMTLSLTATQALKLLCNVIMLCRFMLSALLIIVMTFWQMSLCWVSDLYFVLLNVVVLSAFKLSALRFIVMLSVSMLTAVVLSVLLFYCHAECPLNWVLLPHYCYTMCHFAKCRYSECRGANFCKDKVGNASSNG